MGALSTSDQALSTKPELDLILVEILNGYNFLSGEREICIGMAGAIPMPITLASLVLYYNTFEPPVEIKHFIRVVKAADNEYLSLQNKKQKQKSSPSPASSSNQFPSLPPRSK